MPNRMADFEYHEGTKLCPGFTPFNPLYVTGNTKWK